MPDFPTEPFVEIARRLEIRAAHSWMAVLIPRKDGPIDCDDLVAELHAFLELPVRVVPLKPVSFEALREALHQPDDDAVILLAGSDLEQSDWSSLDLMRSALERDGPVVLWMAPDAVGQLTDFAPNIRSFIGASIFVAGPDGGIMTEEERRHRLEELRQHYEIDDEEIIRRAESKGLPPNPSSLSGWCCSDGGTWCDARTRSGTCGGAGQSNGAGDRETAFPLPAHGV